MKYSHLQISDADKIRTVTLDRPPVNALNTELVAELQEAVNKIGDSDNLRAVVLTGQGKQFCAGADLKERKTMSESEVREFVQNIRTCFYDWYSLEIPIIAALNGGAYGGGLELALMCDIRFAVDGASLGLRETRLGIIPGAGGTQRLSRLTGEATALRWGMTGKVFSTEEGKSDGVIDYLVSAGELDNAVNEFTSEILRAAPIAVIQAKKAIKGGFELPFREALEFETECYNVTIPTDDRLEALKAFAEKRPPEWKGK